MTYAIIDQLPFLTLLLFVFYSYITYLTNKFKKQRKNRDVTIAQQSKTIFRLYSAVELGDKEIDQRNCCIERLQNIIDKQNTAIDNLSTRVNQFASAKTFREGEIRQLKDKLSAKEDMIEYKDRLIKSHQKESDKKINRYFHEAQNARAKAREYKKTAIQLASVVKMLASRIKELNSERL